MIDQRKFEKPLIYLACPYSNPRDMREKRFIQVSKVAGDLIAAGNLVYSPITHTHPMAEFAQLPKGFTYWEELDKFFLERSDILAVLQLFGWRDSTGIQAEMDIFHDLAKPIIYLPEPTNVIPTE